MRSPHPEPGPGLSVPRDAAAGRRAAPFPTPCLWPFAALAAGQGRRASRRRPPDESSSLPSTGASSSLCWKEERVFSACPYTPLMKHSPPPKPSELSFFRQFFAPQWTSPKFYFTSGNCTADASCAVCRDCLGILQIWYIYTALSEIQDLPLLRVRGRHSQARCFNIDSFSGACLHLEARSA